MNKQQSLLPLLQQLEQVLKQNQLWSNQPPSTEQLNSQTPFAADTMSFENWLQFIFIPRFNQLIVNNMPLPSNMSITPMAEMRFGSNYSDVIATLKTIDALVQE